MLKVGIVGGIGPESTLDYYRTIISEYRRRTGSPEYPELVIDSINMSRMLRYVDEFNLDRLVDQLIHALQCLKAAGADFAVIASNTPHIVFNSVKEQSPIPIISIVEETCRHAHQLGCRKLLVIGTSFTMKHDFYRQEFEKYGILSMVPNPADQETIHGIIFPELEEGIIIPEKKAQMLKICQTIIDCHQIDGVVLGCTELPLMIQAQDLLVKVLNTARIHIDAIVNTIIDNGIDHNCT